MKWEDLDHASPAFKKRNPHLYPVGGLETDQPESTAPAALVGGVPQQSAGTEGVAISVALISMRRRLLDPDNLAGSTKPLQDAIAAVLGLDDGDPRITWHYQQLPTAGAEGVIVHVNLVVR